MQTESDSQDASRARTVAGSAPVTTPAASGAGSGTPSRARSARDGLSVRRRRVPRRRRRVVPPASSAGSSNLRALAALARRQWRRVWLRLQTIGPRRLARSLLVLAALGTVAWILVQTWHALLPFQVGFVLAYLLLPLVGRLQGRLGRGPAIVVVFAGGLAVLIAFLALLLPPLIDQAVSLSQATPTAADVTALLDLLRRQYLQLPIEVQQAIADVAARVAATVRDNVLGIAQGTTNVFIDTLLSAVNFISFIVGFLVIPFWLVYVLKDQPVGARALDRLLHPAIRADFWAVLRIVDRTFGRYLRGQLILGLLVGTLVFIGFFVLQLIGVPAIPYQLLLAVLAGLLELVPYFGPVLSAVPAALVALTVSPQAALAVVLMYWGVQQIENYLLVPRVTGDAVDINPAVLMVALIALAQFGFIWLILGAPVLAIARDLFVYAYGRLSEPPRPAGLLPGEPLPAHSPDAAVEAGVSDV